MRPDPRCASLNIGGRLYGSRSSRVSSTVDPLPRIPPLEHAAVVGIEALFLTAARPARGGNVRGRTHNGLKGLRDLRRSKPGGLVPFSDLVACAKPPGEQHIQLPKSQNESTGSFCIVTTEITRRCARQIFSIAGLRSSSRFRRSIHAGGRRGHDRPSHGRLNPDPPAARLAWIPAPGAKVPCASQHPFQSSLAGRL